MENEMNLGLDFDLIPTVRVGVSDGSFTLEVIEMYELPFEKVMNALNTVHGPAQMMAMLEIFKLAVVDQSKLSRLDVLSFNDMADMLGQWAMLSTPPEIPENRSTPEVESVKVARITAKGGRSSEIKLSDAELNAMIEKVLDSETSYEELMQISRQLFLETEEQEQEPPSKQRGRHALPYESEIDRPLNDPGDGFEPF